MSNLIQHFRCKMRSFPWADVGLYLVTAGGISYLLIPFLKLQVITNSEAYTFANVPIDFALYGKFHYPLVSNVYYYSDVNSFIINSPLFFLLSALLLKIIGIGVWQVMLTAFLSIIFIGLVVVLVARKFYGYSTAVVAVILMAGWEYMTVSWQNGRPDPLLGLF